MDSKKTFSKGITAYNAKDFETAYTLLYKDYFNNLSSVKFNFALGRSAFETGRYETALAAFERVEMLAPNNLRNKLEKARIHFMLKMYEDAELAFKEVLDNPLIPINVRNNIEFYLSKITGIQKKSYTYATISLDSLYDSNVNYGSLNKTYQIGSNVYPTEKERSDSAIQASAKLINIYDIGQSNGYALKNQFTFYSKDYKHENNYDISFLSYSPSLLYKYTRYTTELILGLDTLKLNKKSHLNTYYILPRLEYLHTNIHRSILHFKYQEKHFQQKKHLDSDAKHYEIKYGLQHIMTPRSYIQTNVAGIRESKVKGTRIDVDYNEYRIDTVYSNQLTPTYGIELYGEIKKRNYKDYSSLFQSKKQNLSKTMSIKVNAKILQTLQLHLKAYYNRVDSNQDFFSYEKHVITLGFTKTF